MMVSRWGVPKDWLLWEPLPMPILGLDILDSYEILRYEGGFLKLFGAWSERFWIKLMDYLTGMSIKLIYIKLI